METPSCGEYFEPQIEVIELLSPKVICTSGDELDEYPGQEW